MAETLKPLETPASLADIKNELTSVPDTLLADTVEVHSELPYAPNARFQPEKVRQIIERILKEKLGPLPAYDFETAPAMAREIADHVKNEVRGCSSPLAFQSANSTLHRPNSRRLNIPFVQSPAYNQPPRLYEICKVHTLAQHIQHS
uniref:Uncharacterized protein n=1 Tax=Physcomitrium patens TaxID=3218 RepID=A0A2K1K9P9_PHYPA|nr:hypothetical protein PHYPA_009691 [Physcomitrium patens]